MISERSHWGVGNIPEECQYDVVMILLKYQ